MSKLVYHSALICTIISYLTLASLAAPTTSSKNCECNSTSVCGPNGECISCESYCSGTSTSEVCGTDSQTYASACELCMSGKGIAIRYFGKCHSCREQKERYNKNDDKIKATEYYSAIVKLHTFCDPSKFDNINDLPYPYNPTCDENNDDDYAVNQGNSFCNTYWCSMPSGEMIKQSHKIGGPQPDCSLFGQDKCEYNQVTYFNKNEIPNHPEGYCFCDMGEIVCPRNYTTAEEGKWESEELDQLKDDIIEMFSIQYDHAKNEGDMSKHEEVSLAVVVTSSKSVASSELEDMCKWKRDYYDKNRNQKLENVELSLFHTEVYKLTNTKTFKPQLNAMIDVDADNRISLSEWNNFCIGSQEQVLSEGQTYSQKRSIKNQLRTNS